MLPMHSTATGSSGSACYPCTVQLPVAGITLAGFFGHDCILICANFEKLASGFIHAVRTLGGGGDFLLGVHQGGSSHIFAFTASHVCARYWYSYHSMQNAHTTLLTLHDGSRGTRWTP